MARSRSYIATPPGATIKEQLDDRGMSQKEFAQLLQPYDWFCDCIKGILVNFEDVYKLMDDRFLMKCGASIPISRLKYHEVREKYLNYTYRVLRKG